MRLTGPIPTTADDPDLWVAAHGAAGYAVAASPPFEAGDPRLPPFLLAAARANLPIAEVGAWSNPISPDAAEAGKAIEKCRASLSLADQIGARCCVNIAGSRGTRWDGPHPDNLSDDTFDLIVQTVRKIIDSVKPTRTFYTLETMPWIFPDSPDSYLKLLRAIDRRQFAIHLDPVNMINCPSRAYRTGDFIQECFAKLGPHIRSCHAKDITLSPTLTLHLDECLPGTGLLDYPVFLQELSKLDPETTLVLEHLPTPAQYKSAANFIRQTAAMENLDL